MVGAWGAWGMAANSTPMGWGEVFSAMGLSRLRCPCTPKAREALGWGVQEEGRTPTALGFSKLRRQGHGQGLGSIGGAGGGGACTPLGPRMGDSAHTGRRGRR